MAKRVSRKTTNNKTITSNRALARECGVDEKTVRKWRKHPAWSFSKPPWPKSAVSKIEEWRDDNLEQTSNPEMREAKLELVLARTRAVDLDTAIKKHEYVKRADVEREQVRMIHAFKRSVDDFIRGLSKKTRKEVEEKFTALCAVFAGETDE